MAEMDMKEKLVELRKEAAHHAIDTCSAFQHCEDCSYRKYGTDCRDNTEMDYLIKKGVTVQECGSWKYYHKQNKAVCTNCSFERDLDANFGKAITCPNCGAYMPQPPKGE